MAMRPTYALQVILKNIFVHPAWAWRHWHMHMKPRPFWSFRAWRWSIYRIGHDTLKHLGLPFRPRF